MSEASATYDPDVFAVENMEQARQIILTGEGSTSDARWENETPWVADMISTLIQVAPETTLIDYGCGIGRVAKALIDRHGCRVLGVDISRNMRSLAIQYVQSERFSTCSPEMLDGMVANGFRANAAFSIWVLQHCIKPGEDIGRVRDAMLPGAPLFVLNNIYRAVPTKELAWVNDGIDIKATLAGAFDMEGNGVPPEDKTPRDLRDIIFWGLFRKRA
jgi:SAM-dependent methyltransferase